MCNPRRVMIHLTRAIQEAWRTTVEGAATAQGEVRELARICVDIPLDAEMGDRALAMLERIMAGEFEDFPAWEQDRDGNFRRELEGVVLIYRPGTRQLMVEAGLTEEIRAEARACADAGGFTVGEVAAEAVGRYYDDGWGGRTEESARRDAQAAAEEKLAAATDALHRRQHGAEIAAAESQARDAAQAQADREMERLRGETREALRGRLQGILAGAEDRIYSTMNRLVGEAYRRTLIEVVRQNGGRILADERSGSVYNLELEI